jgi:hypothetical protein
MTKMTKRETLEAMIAGFKAGAFDADAAGLYIDYCEKEIDALDKKAAKAKERQAERKAAGDELTETIFSIVSADEFESIADITAKVDGDDVTVGKVQYRLGALAKEGRLEKGEIKIPATETSKARTIVAYKRIG